MASTSHLPVEDLFCPVCRDVFKDPVLLSCSHSFCKACVQQWWRQERTQLCPVCKEIHSIDFLPRNLALKNLCEAFIQERQRAAKRKRTSSGSEDLCSQHAEELKLFCLESQLPVCVVCLYSEKHSNHNFRPIDEAALDHKEKVKKLLKPLQDQLKVFTEVNNKSILAALRIKVQTRDTQTKIKEQFQKLHQFLQEEEEASIAALMEEEQWKSQGIMEQNEAVKRGITTLSNNIRATEEELRADHISFLQNYKTTMERVQMTLQEPQPVSGPQIDVAKHLGNLTFRVWDKMKNITAGPPA